MQLPLFQKTWISGVNHYAFESSIQARNSLYLSLVYGCANFSHEALYPSAAASACSPQSVDRAAESGCAPHSQRNAYLCSGGIWENHFGGRMDSQVRATSRLAIFGR